MAISNIEAFRARLNELSNKTRISDIIWKPQEGKNVIRIVPLKSNKEFPFIEADFHYLGGKSYLSPKTFGEADPIEEFAQSLRGDERLPREEWNEVKKYYAKPRTFVPIVVRGKESEGVRLWGFGKTTYKELLTFLADEEYGDVIDPETGRDIKVEFTPANKNGNAFPTTTIRLSVKQTPLTKDSELREKLLTEQPNLFDAYKRMSYDELKEVLHKYLNPGVSASSTLSEAKSSTAASSDEWEEESVSSPTHDKSEASAAKEVTEIDKEFEEMFNS